MEFRVPKPLHGWREFAGEVGIVVLGILIALGGEQVVDHFRQKSELRDAEDAMVAELRDDNLPQAYTRAAVVNCYADQLDAIEDAVASGDRKTFFALAKRYHPVNRTWDEQAWNAALSSQVLVHSGARRITGWATTYVIIPALAKSASDEQNELPYLWARQSGDRALSTEQQDRLFQIISLLRAYNLRMTGSSLVLIRMEASQGLTLTRQQKESLLAESRKAYGNCAREPTPERLDLKSQIVAPVASSLGRT